MDAAGAGARDWHRSAGKGRVIRARCWAALQTAGRDWQTKDITHLALSDKVADASEVNIGSVRHYFGSHGGLLCAAAEGVGRRMEERLRQATANAQLDTVSGRRQFIEAVSLALLPVDEASRHELIVLLEFISAARVIREIRDAAAQMGRDMRTVAADALARVGVDDVEFEAERLVAFIDGLTFEIVYPHGFDDEKKTTEILRGHIASVVS